MVLIKLSRTFIKRLSADGIGALSAQAAFFMILSFFPCVMLIIPLIKYIPVDEVFVKELSQSALPERIYSLLNSFAMEIYKRPSLKLISITALTTLWTASGGVLAVMRGFNSINKTDETRGYIYLRMLASIYTVAFILLIALMFAVFLFGNLIYDYITGIFPALKNAADMVICGRTIFGFLILAIFFLLFYYFLPNRRRPVRFSIPGSVFSALAWIIFSYVYSYYIDNISNYSYIYGSLSAVVFLMLWLYICMYIMFIGEELNIFFQNEVILYIKK